jgi:hypothetical protein
MGGWHYARGLYRSSELGGLSATQFCESVRTEGVGTCFPGANAPLHTHNVFHYADLFRVGSPTMVSFTERDVRQGPGTLPVSEGIAERVVGVPWFKHDRADVIEQYATAYRKVAEHAEELTETTPSAGTSL